MKPYKIRRARVTDAGDIARVRITGWWQSYKGLMPDELLNKLDIEADTTRLREAFADKENKSLRFVVEQAGKIIGMGACGKARQSEDAKRGEVYAIYLLDEAKGQGIGTKFMREMVGVLMANGFESLQVCVLESNAPARKFYEKLGGRLAGKGVFQYGGFEMADVTYVWEDIGALVKEA
ncbi:MAG: GNAT family N-acetyltransferase [Alphaproteobacteria bacterium]|nr:MAG: GNAT family N-acetyltransferase [Alphaproteobacteria bacterium]